MNEKLLSIVIPTKNRVEYVRYFIDSFNSFEEDRVELIIQDNSDSNKQMMDYLAHISNKNIVYQYSSAPLSMVENSELAVKAANGRYICFMGDDDFVSKKLIDFTEQMKKFNIQSAIFARDTSFFWPGVVHKVHKFPSLMVRPFQGKLQKINIKKEYKKLLKNGAMTMGKLPQLYQGVVSRKCIEQVHKMTGSYFPAPCPDMAACVALSCVVKRHLFCDLPLIVSGVAPKSAAGLGAKHMHKAKIKDVASLPKGTAEHWEEKVPRIWTGETIYAESAIKCIRNMKKRDDIKFCYPYFYAKFFVFHITDRKLLFPLLKKLTILELIQFYFFVIGILFLRVRSFVANIFITKFHCGRLIWNNIADSFEAEKIIDAQMKDVDIVKMFEKCVLSGHMEEKSKR